MIPSTRPSPENPASFPAVTAPGSNPRRAVPSRTEADAGLANDDASAVQANLARDPSVRPEAMARARALLADPAYPSMEVLRGVARALVSGPALADSGPES
jgi:hypothetical protein